MTPVLIVAYHYPPGRAVGGIRPSKFVRYLPEYGWDPHVLTVAAVDGPRSGPSAEGIAYVAEWPHPLNAYRWFAKQMGRAAPEAQSRLPFTMEMSRPQRLLTRMRGSAIGLLCIPDQQTGWIVPAVARALGLLRKHRIRHIVTTAPPFSVHLVGLLLKRLARVTWVADFRDPWSLSARPAHLRSNTADRIERRLMRKVLASADTVVSVTPQIAEVLQKESLADPGKFVTLYNGFDAQEFADCSLPPRQDAPVRFSYIGTFYHGRSPEPFLKALRRLLDDGSIRMEEVRVRFTGDVSYAEGQPVIEIIKRLKLDQVVTLEGQVSRENALTRMAASHVALVLDERHPTQVPLKLYEALASGAFVLNIGCRGAVSDLLARTGHGVSADYRHEEEVRNATLEAFQTARAIDWGSVRAPWLDAAIQPFDYKHLTGRLAGLLETMAGTGPVGPRQYCDT